MNSTTSMRRSPPSYFAIKDCGRPNFLARAAPPLRHRAHHRTPEGRRSPRPLLPQRPRRRRRQRHPLSRGPQLPPYPRLAQRILVSVPVPAIARALLPSPAQFGFLTDDGLAALKTEQGARYLIQNFLYRHVQAHTGADYYTPFFIRSVDNHRSYWLLHLSKHARARDEMARLHWDMTNTFVHHGGAGFNALGFDPNIDPDQSGFEFDFGSDARADSLNAALKQRCRRGVGRN
jgi:hypothetical protein